MIELLIELELLPIICSCLSHFLVSVLVAIFSQKSVLIINEELLIEPA